MNYKSPLLTQSLFFLKLSNKRFIYFLTALQVPITYGFDINGQQCKTP